MANEHLKNEMIRLHLENDVAQQQLFLQEVDKANKTPSSFVCPVQQVIMTDPVTCADGMVMERRILEDWFGLGQDTNPVTKTKLENLQLIPNIFLQKEINDWLTLRVKKIPRDSLKKIRKIGEGSFKNVYEGSDGAGRKIAILEAKSLSQPFEVEAETLLRMGAHRNLVAFLGQVVDTDGPRWLVTEFAPLGSLLTFIDEDEQGDNFLLSHYQVALQQICRGMGALAAAGLIHRDLAARNVLVFSFDHAVEGAILVKVLLSS